MPSQPTLVITQQQTQRSFTPVSSTHHHIVQSHSPQFQPHPVYYAPKLELRSTQPQCIRDNAYSNKLQQTGHQIITRDEYETLDLSMKKRTPSPQILSHPLASGGPPPAHQPAAFNSRQDLFYPKYSVSRNRASQLLPSPHGKLVSKVSLPPPLTKPLCISPQKDGSITHGTPLHSSQVYNKNIFILFSYKCDYNFLTALFIL